MKGVFWPLQKDIVHHGRESMLRRVSLTVASGHVACTVRKYREANAGISSTSQFYSVQVALHEINAQTLKERSPASVNAPWEQAQNPEVCLLGNSKSCQVDNQD